MRIAWITRSFLDYRIPVFRELDALVKGNLHLIFCGDYVPAQVADKAREVLGDRAIALAGEWRIGPEDRDFLANRNVSLRFHPAVFGKIRALKPDILVCDGFFKWTLPALLHRILSGTPMVICYERWAHTERFAQWYRVFYRKMIINFTDAMCCNGKLSKKYAVGLGVPAARITTGHMAADTDGLQKQAAAITMAEKAALREKYRTRGVVFLYAGRLIPRKGLDGLLTAWAEFEKIKSDATLLLVGGGPQEQELKTRAASEGLSRVRFAGAVPYEEMALYYAAADVFVIPTLEDNWSLVAPEAMACGLPVLCSKYNGCWPELVQAGRNGWIFDPLNTDDLLRALQAATDAKNQLPEMGRLSRDIVARHTPQTAAQSILTACRIAGKKKYINTEI